MKCTTSSSLSSRGLSQRGNTVSDNNPVSIQVDTHWEYVKDSVESEKEAFRIGFIVALKWAAAGQQDIVERLEEEFDFEMVEVPHN